MQVSTESIRLLRDRTGAGIMDSKRALEAAEGNIDKAETALREKGIARAESKSDRVTAEGIIDSYIHAGSRIGAMVELNCETDFVGRTPEFKELAHSIAMQVAAMAPLYLNESDVPEDEEGSLDQVCLLKQSFIKDSSKTIGDLIMDVRAKVGENIRVGRFARFGLGQ